MSQVIQKKRRTKEPKPDGDSSPGVSETGDNNPQKRKQNAVIELDGSSDSDDDSQMGNGNNGNEIEDSDAELSEYSIYHNIF